MHLRLLKFTYSAWRSFTKDFKDLTRRTASDKILCDKVFDIAKNPRDEYQRGLSSLVYKLLIKTLQVEQLKMRIFLIKN